MLGDSITRMPFKQSVIRFLRWSERYTKTDMVYLAKNGFWLNLNTVVVTFLAFFLSIEFSHLLPKDQFGTYQFALSLGAIVGALSLTGMNTAVTQAVARGFEGTLAKSFRIQITWSILPAIAGLALATYYYFNGNGALSLSLIIVALLLPILNSANVYAAFFLGKKDLKHAFYYSFALNLSYYGGMGLALLFTDSAPLLILVNIGINTLVTVALYLRTLQKHVANANEDPEALTYGKHLSFVNVFNTVAQQTDNIVAFHYFGAVQLAIYVFASTIPERLNTVVKSVSQLALPRFSTSNIEDIRRTIVSKTIRLLLFGLCISTVYAFAAPYIFKILFPAYLDSVPYTQVYAFAASLIITATLPVTALLATKATKELYVYNIGMPLFHIATLVFFGATWGLWGIILAKMLTGIAMIATSLTLVFRARSESTTA